MPDLRDKVASAVRDYVAPALGYDPADMEVTAVEDGIASLRLAGACAGCAGGVPTLVALIEAELKRHVPEVEFVEAVA